MYFNTNITYTHNLFIKKMGDNNKHKKYSNYLFIINETAYILI